MIYRVFIEGWQQECCGAPFAVGDDVSWTLAFLDDETALLRDELNTDVQGRVDRVAVTETGAHVSVLVIDDGPTVSWARDGSNGSTVRTRGILMEERHGAVPADLPVTRGRVRRIFLVTEPYRLADARTWVRAAGPGDLREVPRAPDSFEDRTVDEQAGTARFETGLLVELDLASAGTQHTAT